MSGLIGAGLIGYAALRGREKANAADALAATELEAARMNTQEAATRHGLRTVSRIYERVAQTGQPFTIRDAQQMATENPNDPGVRALMQRRLLSIEQVTPDVIDGYNQLSPGLVEKAGIKPGSFVELYYNPDDPSEPVIKVTQPEEVTRIIDTLGGREPINVGQGAALVSPTSQRAVTVGPTPPIESNKIVVQPAREGEAQPTQISGPPAPPPKPFAVSGENAAVYLPETETFRYPNGSGSAGLSPKARQKRLKDIADVVRSTLLTQTDAPLYEPYLAEAVALAVGLTERYNEEVDKAVNTAISYAKRAEAAGVDMKTYLANQGQQDFLELLHEQENLGATLENINRSTVSPGGVSEDQSALIADFFNKLGL